LAVRFDQPVQDGVAADPKRDRCNFDEFGWITDPDGNRVEFWQPKRD
jgi:hypothetical protein